MNKQELPLKHSERADELAGWLLVDKPGGMSSHDVLARIRRRHRKLKIGHAGTLDPLATGLLLVAVGSSTRLVEATHRLDKSYQARIRLGATSPTDDADGPWTVNPEAIPPDLAQIQASLASLVGDSVMQKPPSYSALHVDGKRAYDLARAGADVALPARPVRIDRIAISNYEWPFLDIEVDCGAGTYIRSIARDAGESLNVGGMIETLRRTRIGPFSVDEAMTLEEIDSTPNLANLLKSPVIALEGWPKFVVADDGVAKIARGHGVTVDSGIEFGSQQTEVALVDSAGRLLALARAETTDSATTCRPYRVFVSQMNSD